MSDKVEMERRLETLRAELPAPSLEEKVMDRVAREPLPRRRPKRRKLAGLTLFALAAACVLFWFSFSWWPSTLVASVQDDIRRASTAHLIIRTLDGDSEKGQSEVWYQHGIGVRAETPNQVLVEDKRNQWVWSKNGEGKAPLVLWQANPGFLMEFLPAMLGIPEVPRDWKRERIPALDKELAGIRCQAYLVQPSGKEKGKQPASPENRALVLAEVGGRVRQITVERREGTEGNNSPWIKEREIRIDYDQPIPDGKLVTDLPPGSRVVDRAKAFLETHPLDRALVQVEKGGLILAVHDVRPLERENGFFVVSSVRGTEKFLKEFPPRKRFLNPELSLWDVAFQPGANQMEGTKFIRIVLATANREGVEYSWWLVLPRRFFQIKEGKRLDLPLIDQDGPSGEPGRLDLPEGKARLPLAATYWDEKHKDARGVPTGVREWVMAPLPGGAKKEGLEDIARRVIRDLTQMGGESVGGLLGVRGKVVAGNPDLNPQSRVPLNTPAKEFAVFIGLGIEDLRRFDEVRDLGPGDFLPKKAP